MRSKASVSGAGQIGARSTILGLYLVVCTLLCAGYSAPAQAQMINPFASYNGPTLGKADYAAAQIVVAKLLNETPPEIGRYEHWNNPASGNHGKFTVLNIFTSKGMPCRTVRADIIYSKAGAASRSFTLDACQLPSGQWKTAA